MLSAKGCNFWNTREEYPREVETLHKSGFTIHGFVLFDVFEFSDFLDVFVL